MTFPRRLSAKAREALWQAEAMTEATAKPIEERFKIALSELIGMCMEAGMHTSEMIEPMETELKWLREQSARTG